MSKWQAFLNSLATAGGNLFVLAFFAVVTMSGSVVILLKFGPSNPVVATIVGTLSASTFVGALVGILRGNSATDHPAPPVDPSPKS